MTNLKLEKDIVVKRIEGIEAEMQELEILSQLSIGEFSTGNGWKLAQFHLHRALEGVFNISTQILSRLPGGVATEYKEIARQMGKLGLVPEDFAQNNLTKMAGYRNRLVHFYAEIKSQELLTILNENLKDFDTFLQAIKDILSHPEKFHLSLE